MISTDSFKVHQANCFKFRYVVFLVVMFIGPSLGLLQLKGFHVAVAFLSLVGGLYWTKTKAIDIKQCQLGLLLLVFLSLWMVFHFSLSAISLRYITFIFYFVFTFIVFYFSFRALITLNKSTVFRVIQWFIYIDFCVVLIEIVLGIALFNYYPLAGSEYQVGSAFWSNMNTNAAVLVILNTSLYFLNHKKAFYLNTIPILVLSLLVDAKLCVIAIVLQLLLTQLMASGLARIVFVVTLTVLTPILFVFFDKQLGYVLFTLNQALDFLSNTDALEAIVSSGQMFSVAIRAYALSEMLNVVADFSVLNWLFGIGFGNLNISFVNNEWGGLVEHFAPHLFYLEMIIYAGICYYIFYILAMKVLAGRIPWRSLLIASPTLGGVIAISSAVYFLPLYFFLAVLVFWEYEQHEQQQK